MNTIFKECQTSGYSKRTIQNASADITFAFAVDFKSSGEKLTKKSVLNQNKIYVPIDANNLEITTERIDKIVSSINNKNRLENPDEITLNIAGNGIYTVKGKLSQEECDDFVYETLKQIIEHKEFKYKVKLIRSGGQTGFDESGIKAGVKLNIQTLVLAPKGWLYRNKKGTDVSDEQLFKKRFD